MVRVYGEIEVVRQAYPRPRQHLGVCGGAAFGGGTVIVGGAVPLPDRGRPLRIAADVLAPTPRHVADVPARAGRPQTLAERLHGADVRVAALDVATLDHDVARPW